MSASFSFGTVYGGVVMWHPPASSPDVWIACDAGLLLLPAGTSSRTRVFPPVCVHALARVCRCARTWSQFLSSGCVGAGVCVFVVVWARVVCLLNVYVVAVNESVCVCPLFVTGGKAFTVVLSSSDTAVGGPITSLAASQSLSQIAAGNWQKLW